jgi:hypothetical protein
MAGKRALRAVVLGLGFAAAGLAQAALPQFEQPVWSALTAQQQSTLAPLADDWATMDAFHRRKWLGIAQRYPDMTPAEQASMQRNMREWARMAPEERKLAREKYKTLKKVSPEQQQSVKQKWEEYQALTDEERGQLKAQAPKRPPIPKTPAKTAASPVVVSPGGAVVSPASPLSPLKAPQSTLVPKFPPAPPPPLPPAEE